MRDQITKGLLRIGIALVIVFLIPDRLFSQNNTDTINIDNTKDRISAVEERITNAEADLAKLTKIKLSGYLQAQWLWSQNPSIYPSNFFMLRRARIKVAYEPVNGVAFVLQPDFFPGLLSVKDAYVQVNEPWMKTFSLWAGQFNRPDYEVEYSSSTREIAERSMVIRTLYPGERAIGAKLEATPHAIPLKVQLAVLNGNDYLIINDAANNNINSVNKDYDNFKDIMARATYTFKFGNAAGLNIGAHGYYGFTKAASSTTINGKYETENNNVTIGSSLNRSWFGLEAQLYLDFLGGMAIKGEYLMGTNAFTGALGTTSVTGAPVISISQDTLYQTTTTTKTNVIKPNILKPFMGYYIYVIKNIGKKHQIAFRYDYFDPNRDLKGADLGVKKFTNNSSVSTTDITYANGNSIILANKTVTKTETSSSLTSGTSDIAYGTISIAWNYFFTDHIKFMINYDIPMNEKVSKNAMGEGNVTQSYTINNVPGKLDYSTVFPQSLLTVRLQVKF